MRKAAPWPCSNYSSRKTDSVASVSRIVLTAKLRWMHLCDPHQRTSQTATKQADTIRDFRVGSAFWSTKSVDPKIRPVYHRLADRVRVHVFLCVLSYYVEWHMRQALAPILFDSDDPQAPPGMSPRWGTTLQMLATPTPVQQRPLGKRSSGWNSAYPKLNRGCGKALRSLGPGGL